MRKKILSFVLALSAVSIMAVPVSAKNNTDTTLPYKKIGFSFSTAAETGLRSKQDKSSHYIKNTSGFDLWVISKSSSGVNCTEKGKAIVPTAERFIYNQVYEKGYRSCRLNITSAKSNVTGYLKGVWSPDSVGYYPPANG